MNTSQPSHHYSVYIKRAAGEWRTCTCCGVSSQPILLGDPPQCFVQHLGLAARGGCGRSGIASELQCCLGRQLTQVPNQACIRVWRLHEAREHDLSIRPGTGTGNTLGCMNDRMKPQAALRHSLLETLLLLRTRLARLSSSPAVDLSLERPRWYSSSASCSRSCSNRARNAAAVEVERSSQQMRYTASHKEHRPAPAPAIACLQLLQLALLALHRLLQAGIALLCGSEHCLLAAKPAGLSKRGQHSSTMRARLGKQASTSTAASSCTYNLQLCWRDLVPTCRWFGGTGSGGVQAAAQRMLLRLQPLKPVDAHASQIGCLASRHQAPAAQWPRSGPALSRKIGSGAT